MHIRFCRKAIPIDLATLFKSLSDPTRLRILNLLANRPLCVCEIQEATQESQVKISKHLAYLRDRELVTRKRQANWNVYSIATDADLRKAICIVAESTDTQNDFSQDSLRLKKLDSDPRCPIESRSNEILGADREPNPSYPPNS